MCKHQGNNGDFDYEQQILLIGALVCYPIGIAVFDRKDLQI